jgi:hypothetical protein
MRRRFRFGLFVGIGAAVGGLTPASGANRPMLQQDARCDVPDSEVAISGRGFPPGGFVYLEAASTGAGTRADEHGRISDALRMGQTLAEKEPRVHRVTLVARDGGGHGPIIARTTVFLASTAASAMPGTTGMSRRARGLALGSAASPHGRPPPRCFQRGSPAPTSIRQLSRVSR